MRYSELDIVCVLQKSSGERSVTMEAAKQTTDINCNEQSVSEILDNISISDGECSTERSDNSTNNNTEQGNKKSKKRVMFKCGDNLVMIREIPPREPSLQSETSEESCSDSESESSEEEESEESDDSCTKSNNDLKTTKKPNLRVARIIREAPIVMKEVKPKEQTTKRPNRKRLTRKVRKESHKEETKTVEKISIKPKQIQLKPLERDNLKLSETKCNKTHIKKKKISVKNRTESPALKANLDCKNSKIILAERTRLKQSKSLLEKREKNYSVSRSLVISEDYTEESIISDISVDQEPLSQSDRRLYSWLLANGRIPGPEQQSPCISPMWDTQGFTLWDSTETGFSNKSVVKAPT